MFTPHNALQSRVYGPTLGTPHPPNTDDDLAVHNPACPRDVIGVFAQATSPALALAVHKAQQASTHWGTTSLPTRQALMHTLAEKLATQKIRLATLLTRETGQLFPHSLAEVQALLDIAQTLADTPIQPRAQTRRTRHLASGELLQALLEGQTVIWIAAAGAPALAWSYLDLLEEAGLPHGVVQLLHGPCADAPAPWPHLPPVPGVCVLAFSEMLPQNLNALIVPGDHTLEQAVSSAMHSVYTHAGQRGARGSVILLPRERAEGFRERFIKASEAVLLGDPLLNHRVSYGPLRDATTLEAFLAQLAGGQQAGARLLSGKGRITRDSKPKNFVGDPEGLFVWPAIWEQPSLESLNTWPWVCGPTISLLVVQNSDEAVALARML